MDFEFLQGKAGKNALEIQNVRTAMEVQSELIAKLEKRLDISDERIVLLEKRLDLKGAELHSSVILSPIDTATFRKLGVNLTCEPVYQTKKLYHG